jgi:hypothetical protein
VRVVEERYCGSKGRVGVGELRRAWLDPWSPACVCVCVCVSCVFVCVCVNVCVYT